RQAQDPEALFYFLEKARARLLIDELSANRATELLPTDIRQQLTTITQEVRLYPEDPLKLDRFRQLQDSILQAYPNYARQRLGSPPPALQTLPDVLAGRELVEYYVSDSTTIALTYSKSQGFFLTQLVEPAVWRPLLTQYREQLTDPDAKVDPELPLRLYQELLAPLPLTSKHDLVIIPDGELYLLPFSALITERPPVNAPYQQWSWLANAHKVGYGFSSQLLDQARRQQPSGNGKALAIAPVARIASDDQLNPQLELPATLLTVRHLASRFPTDTLINAAASHAAFRESADAYSLLHLGTHAYLDGAGSFLLRGSNNNRYTSNDLLSHQLNAELVVIGACETGLGKQLLGEGVASLGRGFARRGAAGLIMSLWSINDAATADLLNLTYDGLAEGQGPTTALQSAGATYRNNSTNPRFGHPYFWAGLVHYGQDEPLSLVQKASWLVPAALVLFVLFGLLYFLARRRSTRQ
ncbi:MAG: CHAT domain-containing protein, partial [Bacteroidota bacterium]